MIIASAKDLFDRLFARRLAYRQAFDSLQGKLILRDLQDFCGANRDLFGDSAREHAYHEGRRSVFLHIAAILGHTTEDLRILSGPDQENEP